MSQKVVRFKPGVIYDDPHCEVPDMADFKLLSEEVQRVKELCCTAVTKKVFETRIAEAERSIVDAKQQMEDVVKSFSVAITKGEWREGFKRDVGYALEQLEKRYAAINDELNKKIEELSKVSEIEAILSQKILNFQEGIQRELSNATVNQERLKKLEESIAGNSVNSIGRSVNEEEDQVARAVEMESRIALLEKRVRGMGSLVVLSVVGALVATASLIIMVVLP